MPTPIAVKPTQPSFGSDKAKKRKMVIIFGVLLAGIVLVFFVKKRKTVEDPVVARQAKAEQDADANMKDAQAPVGLQAGGPQSLADSGGGDEPFLKQMQEFKKQQIQQQEDLKKSQDARTQQEVQAARDESRKNQDANAVPSSVGPDGTARQGQGGQPATPEKMVAPPFAGYDTTSWEVTQGGRVRPAYQTGGMYPADPQQHGAMEQRWFNSFDTPVVVGLDATENAAMTRLKADTAQIQGGVGNPASGVNVRGRVPAVKDSRATQGDAAHWGGWITIRPVAADPAK